MCDFHPGTPEVRQSHRQTDEQRLAAVFQGQHCQNDEVVGPKWSSRCRRDNRRRLLQVALPGRYKSAKSLPEVPQVRQNHLEDLRQVAQQEAVPDVHPPGLERDEDKVAFHESPLCRHRHILSVSCKERRPTWTRYVDVSSQIQVTLKFLVLYYNTDRVYAVYRSGHV